MGPRLGLFALATPAPSAAGAESLRARCGPARASAASSGGAIGLRGAGGGEPAADLSRWVGAPARRRGWPAGGGCRLAYRRLVAARRVLLLRRYRSVRPVAATVADLLRRRRAALAGARGRDARVGNGGRRGALGGSARKVFRRECCAAGSRGRIRCRGRACWQRGGDVRRAAWRLRPHDPDGGHGGRVDRDPDRVRKAGRQGGQQEMEEQYPTRRRLAMHRRLAGGDASRAWTWCRRRRRRSRDASPRDGGCGGCEGSLGRRRWSAGQQ
mmetsp:Transcript_15249/g.38222  ORF Transcript_15249/g.38222 Transcript_15249/m.38222 type:complete len:270 (+) Transcript_15249:457-1266(+)